jgi:hypothetical protein
VDLCSWNSIIHTLMYAYYAGTIQGINLGPVKWLMTFLQIFSSSLAPRSACGIRSTRRQLQDRRASQRRSTTLVGTVSTFYTGALVVLFTDFFLKSYLGGKRKSPASKPAAADTKKTK